MYWSFSIALQEEAGVVSRPIRPRGLHGELFVNQDEQVDQLAAGEFGPKQAGEALVEEFSVQDRPIGMETVGLDMSLVVGAPGLFEEIGELLEEFFVVWHGDIVSLPGAIGQQG